MTHQRRSGLTGVVWSMNKRSIKQWVGDHDWGLKACMLLFAIIILRNFTECVSDHSHIPFTIMLIGATFCYLAMHFYRWAHSHATPLAMTAARIHQLLEHGGYVQVERLDEDNVYITHHKEGADHE